MRLIAIATAALLCAGAARAAPPGPRDPDWPCFQIKVPTLSLASVWTGPPLDAVQHSWSQDPAVADLVARIVQRRLPMDQADAAIAAFAQHAGEHRPDRLLAVMAGAFETLNDERSLVLAGLDRYGRRQKQLAEQVRGEAAALRAQQAAAAPDPQAVGQAVARLNWDARVFEDRRQSVSTACDVPTVIEQRLYGLAQAILKALG